MKTLKNFSFVLALAISATAAGCASDPTDQDDDGDGPGGDDTPVPTDATGRYMINSTFDIATNVPGKVGEVTNAFIAMTDGAADPADWILEQVIAKVTNTTLKGVLNGVRPFVAGYLNERMLQLAPDFVTTIVQLGKDFGQASKNFGLNETFEITGSPGAYMSTVSAVGFKFTIDSVETDVLFSATGKADVIAPNVSVALDGTGKFDISEHKLPVPYGQILHLGLDNALIPGLDPAATNLQTLLTKLVDCQKVGTAIYNALVEQVGIGGGASLWQTACLAGLGFGAQTVYSRIDALDSSNLEFGLTGTAHAVDTNGDKKIDKIQTGTWSGTLSYGTTPTQLAPATFAGERI